MDIIDPISLDQSCLVNDGTTNKYTYKFNPSARFLNASLAVQSIKMVYSWFNFSSLYNNTTFQLIFPTGATSQTLDITIPNSMLDIGGLNAYIQEQMIAANLYLYDSATKQNVYYFEIITNPSRYAIQINTFLVPIALAGTLGYGTGGTWGTGGLPTVSRSPQITILANGFRDIVGFVAGTYPTTDVSAYSGISSYTPQVSPVSAIKVLCSICNNRYTQPNSFLTSFGIVNTTFGSTIEYLPPEFAFITIQDQSLSEMTITFTDQNNNALPILETQVIINLLLKSKKIE